MPKYISRKRYKHHRKISRSRKKTSHFSTKRGYITFVLILIALFAFLIASGFVNSVNPPYNGTKYILTTPTPYGAYNSLELHTLKFITIMPTAPTSVPLDCGSSLPLYGRKHEDENVYSFIPPVGTPAVAGGKIAMWYHDENALTLGANAPAMKTTPVDTILPSQLFSTWIGDPTQKDNNGYYVFPSLYILDLTLNPTGLPGDAVKNPPHLPDVVYGSWLAYNTGNNPNPANHETLPPGADPFPPSSNNGFVCSSDDCKYGSEVVWNVNNLGLTTGHDYLAVFMVHDGDSDPSGSDIGRACVTIHY